MLVGAGAIGSHVADDLGREGRFNWTIIDDDRLFPHNLARHIARGGDIAQLKAKILADHLNATVAGPPWARAICANLFAEGEDGKAIDAALKEADFVIDASASLVAARHLSDHGSAARRASVFFNPSGEAAVLLAEPAGRGLTLRDLEAQYLSLVLRTEHLSDHLGKEAEARQIGRDGAGYRETEASLRRASSSSRIDPGICRSLDDCGEMWCGRTREQTD